MNRGAGRRAGLVVPLFSCPSSTSWGVGEIPDLAVLARWMAGAGLRALQILPVNEAARHERSPYSALSAMAIDPIFVRLGDVEEFAAAGGEASLDAAGRESLDAARRAPGLRREAVRRLKDAALAAAFDRFMDGEWRSDGPRAAELREFIREEAWWLDEYALFRAIRAREGERAWIEWPEGLRRRKPAALTKARAALAREILFREYIQWQAQRQWRTARRAAAGVGILGDLPFMVSGDSADVWARQDEFLLDASLGVPPDAFSATGQDWGLPVNRWDAMAANHFEWLRYRGRRSAELYDGFRVDHLVGFYRTYGRWHATDEPFFTPPDEVEQQLLGERVLGVFAEAGVEIFVEDLGTVPDFVRASLARLGVPGFRVLRWEREWTVDGAPFRDPASYPARSVATTGTHDTETLAAWWDRAAHDERAGVVAIPAVRARAGARDLAAQPFGPDVRDALLEAVYASGSDLLLLPVQDVFGWRDRINEPATVGERNWTYRLPWPCDTWDEVAEARERQQTLRAWAGRHHRL